jgi:hypothetical protein
VADFDDAALTELASLIDFIAPEEFGVVAEIAEEPVQFPQCSLRAVQTSGNRVSAEFFRFKHGKAQQVKRLPRIPLMLGSFNPDQK